MPIKKSAKKYMRSSSTRATKNEQVKKAMKKAIKSLRSLIEAEQYTQAQEAFKAVQKVIDKASRKKVIKKNNADRKKSRLVKAIKKIKK